MDGLLERGGEQPVHHFHLARTDLAPASPQASDLSGRFDWAISIRMKRGSEVIRALFFRCEDAGRFSDRDALSLQLIAPILAESATRVSQLARQSRHSAMLEAMFDRVSMSMALLSADGQPLFMNSAAGALVGQRRWLIRAADGAIVAANPAQAKGLRDAIRRAATAQFPVEEAFRLDCRDGDWRLAYVLSAKSRSGGAMARCAMLIIMGPGKVDAPSSLLEALGLLPSEQRFLGHFLKSSSGGMRPVGGDRPHLSEARSGQAGRASTDGARRADIRSGASASRGGQRVDPGRPGWLTRSSPGAGPRTPAIS
jgi:PAS domain-containing protein